MDDDLLGEQIEYYRARAPEYDDWIHRRGMYDFGEDRNAQWRVELGQVGDELDELAPSGEVLELAVGTGQWTARLASSARRVTAVDASPEALGIARAKFTDAGLDNVELVRADLFSWEPEVGRYDLVFFGFWLSHVPDEHLDRFWHMVAAALRPGGRFFLVDNAMPRADPDAVEPGVHIEGATITTSSGTTDLGSQVSVRRLADGRRFRIVKRFTDPTEIEADLTSRGWASRIRSTDEFFVYGSGRLSDRRQPD